MQPAVSFCIMFAAVSVCSFIAVAGVALIALGSAGLLKSSSSSSSSSSSTSDSSSSLSTSLLNDLSIYPNGSYSKLLSSFSQASSAFALLSLNSSVLNQTILIDNSSSIFEAGRVQYLYFLLPSGWSGSSTRSLSASSDTNLRASRASPNVITGIALHFGAVGNDNFVVVIPIPNVGGNNQQYPGVATINRTDGSAIIRIQITVPSLLCPSRSGTPVDGCLTLTYQAYSVVNSNQITSYMSIDSNVACGDVCSLSSSLCSASCTTCDGQQVAGADTPVSRRYSMGSKAATFVFDYQTYTIKDRIAVWNSGSLIFDTGCVGATSTVNVTYSSSSSSIRVDVEPNCACTSPYGCVGTLWYFTVSCLNKTSTRGLLVSSVISELNHVQVNKRNIHIINIDGGKSPLTDKEYIERGFHTK